MHVIFFLWLGTMDDLRQAQDPQTGEWYHSHGNTRAVQVGPNAFVCAIETKSTQVRESLGRLSTSLTLLPGPNAKLQKHHTDALDIALPQLKLKEGDPCAVVLSHTHLLFNDHVFNPNNY